MAAHAATPAPIIPLQELYRIYTSIAPKPGVPVPLSAFNMSQRETERVFSAYDEDYHISRYFHFHDKHGDMYSINGETATHVVIDPDIRLVL